MVVSWASSRETRALSASRRTSVGAALARRVRRGTSAAANQQHRRIVDEHRAGQLGFPRPAVPNSGDGGIERRGGTGRQRTDAVEIAFPGQGAQRRVGAQHRCQFGGLGRDAASLSMIMPSPETLVPSPVRSNAAAVMPVSINDRPLGSSLGEADPATAVAALRDWHRAASSAARHRGVLRSRRHGRPACRF